MKLPVPAIVHSLCAVLATASPIPDVFVPPPRPDDWDPSQVHLADIVYNGDGCPPGTVEVSGLDDWTAVSLFFSEYTAHIGPRYPPPPAPHRNCAISFKLHHPPGWTYTVYDTVFQGKIILDPGVLADQQSRYRFITVPPSAPQIVQSQWKGPTPPLGMNYEFLDTFRKEDIVWSPCGKATNLNVNTEINVDNSGNQTGSGYITTEVIDHGVQSGTVGKLGICWKKC